LKPLESASSNKKVGIKGAKKKKKKKKKFKGGKDHYERSFIIIERTSEST